MTATAVVDLSGNYGLNFSLEVRKNIGCFGLVKSRFSKMYFPQILQAPAFVLSLLPVYASIALDYPYGRSSYVLTANCI